MMSDGSGLRALGWNEHWQQALAALGTELEPARVAVEHRIDYEVLAAAGRVRLPLASHLRASAVSPVELPAVGDWVALAEGHVQAVLPRRSAFVRRAAREPTRAQVIAANIDVVFIVTSANNDFNPRRIERYLAAVQDSGATPVLVVNKVDLCESPEPLLAQLGAAREGLAIACVSSLERRGKASLDHHLMGGKTAALVGMSGVGKSSIANWLLCDEALATAAVRGSDDRGQHTTSHRTLLPLPGGGVLIDTPGMRELGLWMDAASLARSFADIEALARQCRFRDCKHLAEPGCAVRAAIAAGTSDSGRVAHYELLREELLSGSTPKPRGPRRRGRT
jgi:ribosome biogenesis GTPase / thiamine phosphate phosphatase